MRNQVLRYDVDRWSAEFLAALRSAGEENQPDEDDPIEDLEWTVERIRHR